MTDAASAPRARPAPPAASPVLQVERRDYTALAPQDRERAQPLQGFEPVYTDIVDYIIRCTHRIWDERDVGLIYTHYAHNAVVYGTLGTTHSREEVVRATIQRIAEYPDRRGLGQQVIWGSHFHLRDGRVVEEHTLYDELALRVQARLPM